MLAKTYSYGINGLEAYPICIEVDVTGGLPSMHIVGLPDNCVKESKERVKSAIKNSGFSFEPRRITINLSPAHTKKEGPSFDLAMALGILVATKQIHPFHMSEFAILGELSLDGRIQPVKGALSIALSVDKNQFKGIILPQQNAYEASMSNHTQIYPVHHLQEVIHFLEQPEGKNPFQINRDNLFKDANHYEVDFNEVKGQSYVKRGLEIAAAGAHNCLLIGPPGSGKSMLAKRIPTILPDMNDKEMLEVTKIQSVTGHLKNDQRIATTRPFRSPHHTTSDVAVVGGGSTPKPGEVTLSHNGILFLDELPEFSRNVLESLRQPLEDQTVTISRATKTLQFPSKFMLVCAMNPCLCGWFMDPKKECHCTPIQIQKYLSKISGPLLDRIDIHLEVPSLPSIDVLHQKESESSSAIKERTSKARGLQHNRFDKSSIFANAQMNNKQIKEFCPLSDDCKTLIKRAFDELSLSARAYDKILKVSRTIADLANEKEVLTGHIAEAIQYRNLDRNWWG